VAPQPLIDALHARDWQRLMVALRPLWVHSRLLPVGHALLEKLVAPRKAITAHLLCLPTDGTQALPAAPTCLLCAMLRWPASPCCRPPPWRPSHLPAAGAGGAGLVAGKQNFSFYDDS
jgi:hypothetical protein